MLAWDPQDGVLSRQAAYVALRAPDEVTEGHCCHSHACVCTRSVVSDSLGPAGL